MDGSDPLYDRNELHDIYRSWREVFDEYDPPRMAVAEVWTPTSSRTYLYARPDELGQVFDFSLLNAPWDRNQFEQVINTSIADHASHAQDGGGLTWVLSTHDVPRHASRLALPSDVAPIDWVSSHGLQPVIDENLGRRRAHAATLMMLALPGSAYLFQGEELGLPEVADIPIEAVQDPIAHRTCGAVKGRDGCRVPLPWQSEGPSFGFSERESWLPQPAWLGRYAVQAQLTNGRSSLQLYRAALSLRHALQIRDTQLLWLSQPVDGALHFRRANGWECLVNFSDKPIPLPPGQPILRSDCNPLGRGTPLDPDAAVWLWRP
jgi:alpha-glucosidase